MATDDFPTTIADAKAHLASRHAAALLAGKQAQKSLDKAISDLQVLAYIAGAVPGIDVFSNDLKELSPIRQILIATDADLKAFVDGLADADPGMTGAVS